MAVALSNTGLQAEVNGLTPLFNSGFINIYSGTQPANANTALSGNTLLAQFTMNATAFGASNTTGLATANTISSVTASATGTATFARFLESNGTTVICDCTVGTSGTDLLIGSVSITSGETVSVSSLTYQGN